MKALVARLDSFGDVLLAGPAVRAVAARADRTTLLCGPLGAPAARMLPGVDEVIVWDAPWVGFDPPPVEEADVARLVGRIAQDPPDAALILTSFHQSPLPLALLLRMAGVRRLAADCEDYPGALLDLRHHRLPHRHEVEASLDLAEAAGFPLPQGDDGRLAVRRPAGLGDPVGEDDYVVVHPGAAVPARQWGRERFAAAVRLLQRAGYRTVVTGGPGERELTAAVANGAALDLGGRTTSDELAGVLSRAAAVVAGNTGPAHLAAAVGTPVVSLFAPVVPAERWAPFGVPHVLLGDPDAPCAGTRARVCPVVGHPCLGTVSPEDVLAAVEKLTGRAPGLESRPERAGQAERTEWTP
ncbi:glycosyltransferase family 9 protein [Streptomyces sp. NPDC008001]|uniref:glycosyltransferase family 9 protein n=1 Tax=Streptomyces sp. NPDC008001 TaxID=3364804 RepID=UPI0036ECF989